MAATRCVSMCRRGEGGLLKLEASGRFVKKGDQVILNVVNAVVGAGRAASQIQYIEEHAVLMSEVRGQAGWQHQEVK